ncbi:MAG: hypothetical protein L6V95_08670 [Candidatus Melainabacteria bacterium]|nr:MAG: hypothetical protein L6V95_08670 [Candidatus Melainabacteria bacterium]
MQLNVSMMRNKKRVFKLLGFKDGTSFENLRLLIHSINCVNSLNGIDELNQDIKPDTVLSTSTYSKIKNKYMQVKAL